MGIRIYFVYTFLVVFGEIFTILMLAFEFCDGFYVADDEVERGEGFKEEVA